MRQQLSDESAPSDSLSTSTVARNAVTRALPKITLPKFSGEYNSWPAFRDLFTSMITDNSEIAPVEKLHYLKNNLLGEAAKRIANFNVTGDNFVRAWDVLVDWYENPRILITAYFDQLFRVKPLTRKSADDLKELVAMVKETMGGLQPLGTTNELWDYFVVYFIANRLDADSREAWELHQESSTKSATFHQLEVFLDGRTQALEMVASRVEKPSKLSKPSTNSKAGIRSLAATTNKCVCCNEAHYVSRCPAFSAKSIAERRDFVNIKKLCFNCLGPHKISDCRTTKRCHVCNIITRFCIASAPLIRRAIAPLPQLLLHRMRRR
ncbi:hypothetical protein X777_10599 [Ooceraea biroi]|uniref:Uncharacterized protein n=1 Tax=Ooceraea biroi TaxID=2015173 RepID=A0A026W5T2_OOCBI|nr:hypothetical protein X777_10599 [Ooceraea biroi]